MNKEMCGGLGRAHSGYSPRRAIMGNRHIPVQRLPTPYLFSRKEKQRKNVRVLDRHRRSGGGDLGLGGFCHVAMTVSHGGGDRGGPGGVS